MELTIKINGQVATCNQPVVLTSSSQMLTCLFEFDSLWDGMAKTALFTRNGITEGVILQDNKCKVPSAVIKNGGFVVSVLGSLDGKIVTTTNQCAVMLNLSGYIPGITLPDPDPDVYQQIMDLFEEHTELARDVVMNRIHKTEVNSSGELVITYIDGEVITAGKVVGPQGEKGLQGDPGPTGPRGLTGATGPEGPRGQQGEQGPAGRDGTKLYVEDVFQTLDELRDAYPEGNDNMYVVLSNNHCYIYSESNADWMSVGQLQGAQGLQGVQGVKGDQGNPGRDGLDGQDGVDGASAYDAARAGGFAGDEEDFNRTMANLANAQVKTNMVGELTENVTDTQYPSAKAVYNAINRTVHVSTVLDPTKWVDKIYDISDEYPSDTYDIVLYYDGDNYSAPTKEAFDGAGIVGSMSGNRFIATGDVPAISIPVILEVTAL